MTTLVHNIIKSVLITLMLLAPAYATAEEPTYTTPNMDERPEKVDKEENVIKIAGNKTVQILNAKDLVMEVYSITGEKLHTQVIETNAQSVNLASLHFNSKCIIIRVGNKTRKFIMQP